MPVYLNQFFEAIRQFFTLDTNAPWETGAKAIAILGSACTIGTALLTKFYPWAKAKLGSRSISKRLGARLFTTASVERTVRYYIPPSCQSLDPAGGEESRLIHSVQSSLFDTLDKVLSPSSDERYHILLADSGMGKTSALINYYARHLNRWRKRYQIEIIPLGIPDADERIKNIGNKSDTVLFLDALDEDIRAIKDHIERLNSLLQLTHEFLHVLITCRTQFFSMDEEIPRETGVLKFGPRKAGEPAEHFFYKIYLSPFTDQQVDAYLKRRYPIWQQKKRRQAFRIVEKIPHLTARPMLLAHVDDLVRAKRSIHYSFELYDEMIEAWLTREQGFIENKDDLRQFSERLAVDLYVNKEKRGAERIPRAELSTLAEEWNIALDVWKLSGRSLLNRDVDGNFKFAHRSIMEYLFIKRFIEGERRCLETSWTDQMRTFFWEIVADYIINNRIVPFSDPQHKLNNISFGDMRRKALVDVFTKSIEFPRTVWNLPARERLLIAMALLRAMIERNENKEVKVLLFKASKASYPVKESVETDSLTYKCMVTIEMVGLYPQPVYIIVGGKYEGIKLAETTWGSTPDFVIPKGIHSVHDFSFSMVKIENDMTLIDKDENYLATLIMRDGIPYGLLLATHVPVNFTPSPKIFHQTLLLAATAI